GGSHEAAEAEILSCKLHTQPRAGVGVAIRLRVAARPQVALPRGSRARLRHSRAGPIRTDLRARAALTMIDDARHVREGESLGADICIVGAGAAGITLALALIGSGLEVLLLESGGRKAERRTQQ